MAYTIEMKTKYLEHYVNLVDKAVVGFERTDSNFETSSTVDKMLSNFIACCTEKLFMKERVNWFNKLSTASLF